MVEKVIQPSGPCECLLTSEGCLGAFPCRICFLTKRKTLAMTGHRISVFLQTLVSVITGTGVGKVLLNLNWDYTESYLNPLQSLLSRIWKVVCTQGWLGGGSNIFTGPRKFWKQVCSPEWGEYLCICVPSPGLGLQEITRKQFLLGRKGQME